MTFRVETKKRIASDSPDHLCPVGCVNDNFSSQKLIDEVLQYFEGKQITALDLGCAGGQFIVDFIDRGHKAIGLEGSSNALKGAGEKNWNKYLNKNLFLCDLTEEYQLYENDVPLKVDFIHSEEVFEHIHPDKIDFFLQQIRKHLKDDGICSFGISMAHHEVVIDDVLYVLHQSVFPAEWWKNKLLENGFEILEGGNNTENYFGYIFNNIIRNDCSDASCYFCCKKKVENKKLPLSVSPKNSIAFICAHRETDVWSTPLSIVNEFKRLGWKTEIYSLFDSNDNYVDDNIHKLLKTNPDIIIHMDFGQHTSPILSELRKTGAFCIMESGDDPQRFYSNQIKAPWFDLILSPDIRCVEEYRKMGYTAEWHTHFSDTKCFFPLDEEPTRIAVCSRGMGNDATIIDSLAQRYSDKVANQNGLWGSDHNKFLNSGKIVLQQSRYGEITRRIFEGMSCKKLVLADRLDTSTKIQDLFVDGEDIVFYDGEDDCLNKINYYDSHPEEAKRIAENGYNKVLNSHTEKQRTQFIIDKWRENQIKKNKSLVSILEENPFLITDKNCVCFKKYPEQWTWMQYHSYIENFYEKAFKRFQNKKDAKICEIGIDVGGSIALWSKYFEDGTIIGIDINSIRLNEQYREENFDNVKYYINDAYNKEFINSLSSFDIIIDDGPHTFASMLIFIEEYIHKLNDGGIMVIEDIPDIKWIDYFKLLIPSEMKTMVIDLREIDQRYDSLLFSVEKQ